MHEARRPGKAFGHGNRDARLRQLRGRAILVLAIGVIAAASNRLPAQDTSVIHAPATLPALSVSPVAGPSFYIATPPDGEWVDGRDAPVLRKRLSLTLVGVPLATALQAIGERAGVELAFSTELIPLGARVSMKADDVTVAAALGWVLANARLDVLVTEGNHLTLVPHPPALADSSSAVVGTLVDAENSRAVPYGTVILVGTEYARFADADGQFRLTGLRPGTYTLRARQIGYSPHDTALRIDTLSRHVPLVVQLHRIPAVLPIVRVNGGKDCVATGPPDSAVNPGLAAIFAQVRENIDRFRLVLAEYPFRYRREERMVLRLIPGGDITEWVDTVAYESQRNRAYQVGDVVFVDSGAGRHARRHMELPTFGELGDSAFLTAHCFSYGRARTLAGKKGPKVLEIDFRPASAIASPDVEGSIYLDAKTFIVRRAVFRLTKPGVARPPVLGLSVTTTFREIVPLVPVFDGVASEQRLPRGPARGQPDTVLSLAGPVATPRVDRSAVESYRVLDAAFESRVLGEQPAPVVSSTADSVTPADAQALRGDVRRAGPTTASSARLVGRVVQRDGTPVPRALVGLFGVRDTTTTDDSGRFVVRAARAGPHMLWVSHAGFGSQRVPVTIDSDSAHDVTMTLAPQIPNRPASSDAEAYHAIGLDRRMRQLGEPLSEYQGGGHFATGRAIEEQIRGGQGVRLSQLLRSTRAFAEWPRSTPVDRAWVHACLAIAIDGVPEVHLTVQAAVPLANVDHLIDPAGIGAIEAYPPGDRSSEFAGLDAGAAHCTYVFIWTRDFLALGQLSDSSIGGAHTESRGRAVFPDSTTCRPPAPWDSIDVPIYATLVSQTRRPRGDMVRSGDVEPVLTALRSAFVMPSVLELPVFGYVFRKAMPTTRESKALQIAPTVASVIGFMLEANGGARDVRVEASALTGGADTAVLAGITDGASSRAVSWERRTDGERDAASWELRVTAGQPAIGDGTLILGRVHLPGWPLGHLASPAANAGPVQVLEEDPISTGRDSLMVEFVVDERGRVVTTSAHAVADSGAPGRLLPNEVLQALQQLQFHPALVQACPVRQLVRRGFVWY